MEDEVSREKYVVYAVSQSLVWFDRFGPSADIGE